MRDDELPNLILNTEHFGVACYICRCSLCIRQLRDFLHTQRPKTVSLFMRDV